MEVLIHGLPVDHDAPSARLDTDLRSSQLALAIPVRVALFVDDGHTSLLRQLSTNVKQVDAVVLQEVIGIVNSFVTHTNLLARVILFGHFAYVRPQVMLKVRILFQGVEQGDLLVLLLG